MTYENKYLQCETLEELEDVVSRDLTRALLLNPDRVRPIKYAAEKVANELFNTELKNK